MAQPVTQTAPTQQTTIQPTPPPADGPPIQSPQLPELPKAAKSISEVYPTTPSEVYADARRLRTAIAYGNHELVFVPPPPQANTQPQRQTIPSDPRFMAAPTAGKVPTPEEMLVMETKSAVEKYFRKHGLNFPQDFNPTSGTYDEALRTMLAHIYNREGVVDKNGSPQDGTRIDFRALGVLYPEEYGMEKAQRALAGLNAQRIRDNVPSRVHLGQLNDPAMLAPTADTERLMRVSLQNMQMPEIAGMISVDGKLASPKPGKKNDPELSAVAELQRLMTQGITPDRLVGASTLNELQKLELDRFTRTQNEQRIAQGSVLARAAADLEAMKDLYKAEQINNIRQEQQIQQLQVSDSRQSSHLERKRLLENLSQVAPDDKLNDEKFLRRLVDGLSAYIELPSAEYSKGSLRKSMRSNDETEKRSNADYDEFLKENGMIAGKPSRVIFLQTKAAILLEQIRTKEHGPASLTADRGLEASDMSQRAQTNAPANPNGTIVINISQPESGNPAFEAKMRQVVKDSTERKFLGLFSY